MDVRSPSPGRARELAALRLRAYGPDADIHGDASAVARLRELESESRAANDDDEIAPLADLDETPALGAGEDPAASGDTESDGDDTDGETPDAATRRPWWRAVPVWVIAVVAVVVGAAAGAGAVVASQPHPDVVLRVAPAHGQSGDSWERALQSWGISPGSATPYGLYNGVGVWTASSDDGSRCIMLEDDSQPISVACIGAGFDPVLDLTTYAGMDRIFDDPPAAGSVVRFIARDGGVEVWLRERQTIDTSWSVSIPSA